MKSRETHILVIDANDESRRGCATLLRKENYAVETGKNMTEAVKKISSRGFDCLIMDVDLPEMKGYQAVPILKRIAPDIKVILTTRKNTRALEAKVRAQDIFFYFIKSFGMDELKLAIKNAVK